MSWFWLGLRKSTSIGAPSRPLKRSRMMSLATATELSFGRMRSSTWPKLALPAREVRPPSRTSTMNKIGSGRRMTERLIFSQMPVSLGERSPFKTLNLLTRSPSKLRAAGSAKIAPSIAKPTTLTPAMAKVRRKYCGKKLSASMTTATVSAEKNTVRPAVITVVKTESSTLLPVARSSRKRFTISSA